MERTLGQTCLLTLTLSSSAMGTWIVLQTDYLTKCREQTFKLRWPQRKTRSSVLRSPEWTGAPEPFFFPFLFLGDLVWTSSCERSWDTERIEDFTDCRLWGKDSYQGIHKVHRSHFIRLLCLTSLLPLGFSSAFLIFINNAASCFSRSPEWVFPRFSFRFWSENWSMGSLPFAWSMLFFLSPLKQNSGSCVSVLVGQPTPKPIGLSLKEEGLLASLCILNHLCKFPSPRSVFQTLTDSDLLLFFPPHFDQPLKEEKYIFPPLLEEGNGFPYLGRVPLCWKFQCWESYLTWTNIYCRFRLGTGQRRSFSSVRGLGYFLKFFLLLMNFRESFLDSFCWNDCTDDRCCIWKGDVHNPMSEHGFSYQSVVLEPWRGLFLNLPLCRSKHMRTWPCLV